MNRKKFLYFANSTADAVCIDASKVTDVEINSDWSWSSNYYRR